jgi:hypothetical protein
VFLLIAPKKYRTPADESGGIRNEKDGRSEYPDCACFARPTAPPNRSIPLPGRVGAAQNILFSHFPHEIRTAISGRFRALEIGMMVLVTPVPNMAFA